VTGPVRPSLAAGLSSELASVEPFAACDATGRIEKQFVNVEKSGLKEMRRTCGF